jgi:hypothetical protein
MMIAGNDYYDDSYNTDDVDDEDDHDDGDDVDDRKLSPSMSYHQHRTESKI